MNKKQKEKESFTYSCGHSIGEDISEYESMEIVSKFRSKRKCMNCIIQISKDSENVLKGVKHR